MKTTRFDKLRRRIGRQRSHRWWSALPHTRAHQIFLWSRDLWDEWEDIAGDSTLKANLKTR